MADILDFNLAQMYFGEPYMVNEKIAIKLPTVGEIIKFDDRKYYSIVSTLCSIPSDMKSFLFDAGIDYEEISDFDFFRLMSRVFTAEDMKILMYNPETNEPVDFTQFGDYMNQDTQRACMYNPRTEQVIDDMAYVKISEYLRKAHNIIPKVEKAANKTTKRILIQLDREDREKRAKEGNHQSVLMPMISAMMRYPGFKYKSSELKECGIYEFMDAVVGASIYIQSTALLQGSYSGMIDTSKINKKQFDWTRSTIE